MDKETNALINFYDNKIKDLEDKNKEKQDKLDKIQVDMIDILKECEELVVDGTNTYYIKDLIWQLNYFLQIIKGEDK